MHVVHVVDTIATSAGGTARATLDLTTALSQICDIDCSIVTCKCETGELDYDHTIKVFKLSTSRLLHIGKDTWDILSHIHKSHPIDLIHINGIWSPLLHFAITYSTKARIPYIVSPHGMLEPWSLQQKNLKKKVAWNLYQKRDLEQAAAVHVTAQSELNSVLRLLPLNTILVPNGLNIPQLEEHSSRKKNVLFLSRIHPKKGLPLLLESWATLRPHEWTLQIVGPGDKSYIESIKKLIQTLNLSGQVEVHPEADSNTKYEFYRNASLFVLPTHSENFGLVVAEAMAIELPVITTSGTPWTTLDSIGAGWCIDLSQSNLTKCLSEALATPQEQLQVMGKRGREHIKSNFAWEHVARQMLSEYRKILQPHSHRDQNSLTSPIKVANAAK